MSRASLARTFAILFLAGEACTVAGADDPQAKSGSNRNDRLTGVVLGAGAPIAGSAVTVWEASEGAPRKVAEAKTNERGEFQVPATSVHSGNSLYLTAVGGQPKAAKQGGDNSAVALMTVLGDRPPSRVALNELTTIASVWTHAQFLEGTEIKGPPLGLRIAAGNVPSFVDLTSGAFGGAILDAINGKQTPTMANFGTLSNLVAACVTRLRPDACSTFFTAATDPRGKVPVDTLAALHSIARYPAYQPKRVFALLEQFYPVEGGERGKDDKRLRPAPFLPYLTNAPSAWVLPLKFTGGGLSGPGKIMFDSEGNAWTGVNFIIGGQSLDAFWNGNLSKFAPNGRALSPSPSGFTGGGILGPGFGTAITSDDKVWVTSTSGKTISLFDKTGKPLSPPEGYNFGGRLGLMQGIIVAPNGDVWTLDFGRDQVVQLPQGDASKAKFYCQAPEGKSKKDNPCKLKGPFHLAIDQKDRIWVTNAVGDTVTRFPANDPTKFEVFPTGGHSGKGMAIDSRGNAWIANTAGKGLDVATKAKLLELKVTGKMKELDQTVYGYLAKHEVGSVTMLQPDGKQAPGGSVFTSGDTLWGPWGVAIDGDDHVWISLFMGPGRLAELCGSQPETCLPGMKTGDAISPPGGFAGGGMQHLTDVGVDPAGNVWVADNWEDPDACFGKAAEADSTRCGGDGLTIFYGMAKPVRAPQIGPAQPL
jgi:streptogramin lyase